MTIWVNVEHPGLGCDDLRVELVIGERSEGEWDTGRIIPLESESSESAVSRWTGQYVPERSGERGFGIRIVPAVGPPGEVDLELALAKWA